jgi:hypothetical protein
MVISSGDRYEGPHAYRQESIGIPVLSAKTAAHSMPLQNVTQNGLPRSPACHDKDAAPPVSYNVLIVEPTPFIVQADLSGCIQ